jgi:hypothetical protein
VDSSSRELRESPDLTVGRIIAKKIVRKELSCAKKTSWCAAVTATLMKPLPGYD